MSGAWPCHFVCGVVLLLVFHGFLLVCSCSTFYVLRVLGFGLEKRKVNEARGELSVTQQVM